MSSAAAIAPCACVHGVNGDKFFHAADTILLALALLCAVLIRGMEPNRYRNATEGAEKLV
ncbi:MAG TPA: hypothetical protein VEK75_01725 [Xanthobacteraceae bacterium]|nr:hypothetical protein [Xanthobacteraceae bacterium]